MSPTLDQLRSDFTATNYYVIAWTAILVWDWLALLPREIKHFWKFKGKLSSVRITFLLNRYGTLILQMFNLTLLLSTVPKGMCHRVHWIVAFTLVYVMVVCDVLLSLRVWALLSILLFIEAGLLMATAAEIYRDYRGAWEIIPIISVCAPAWTNAILLGMTVYKSWKVTRQLDGYKLPILKRFVHDGALYFLVITAVDLGNIYFFNQHSDALKGFNTTASIVVTSVVSCRLALSLFEPKPELAFSMGRLHGTCPSADQGRLALTPILPSPLPLRLSRLSRLASTRMATTIDQLRYQTTATCYYDIAWTGIMIWDWLSLLPREIKHFWKFGGKTNTVRLTFFANRYGTLIFQTLNVAFILAPNSTKFCDRVRWVQLFSVAYVMLICDVLLSLRVWALYEHDRKILVILGVVLVVEAGAILATGSQVHPTEISDPIARYINYQGCLLGVYRGNWLIFPLISVSSPAWTNAILLGMTVYRSWKITRELDGIKLPILKRFVHDGVLYFIAITAVDLGNIYFISQKAEAFKGFNTSASIVVSSTLSCRLALSLFDQKPTSTLSLGPIVSMPTLHPIDPSRVQEVQDSPPGKSSRTQSRISQGWKRKGKRV
ncbi:hypothetical protein JCM16303_005022 [Sporobolomyces ruberrimus]